MDIKVRPEPTTARIDYAAIPIAFEVHEVFDVPTSTDNNVPLLFAARRLPTPYVKDYDAVHGEGPLHWSRRFDISEWGVLSAFTRGKRVGGATIAYDTPGLDMLEGRIDLAVLWDIRVVPTMRRRGVGAALFAAAISWASAKGCRQLKVETQNVNVPACRFYARHGCVLRSVNRGIYPQLPDEIQLLWYKEFACDVMAR